MESLDAVVADYALRFKFKVLNNEEEYEAVISEHNTAKNIEVKKVHVHSDSKLVVSQISHDYKAKEEEMKRHLSMAKQVINLFDEVQVLQIP